MGHYASEMPDWESPEEKHFRRVVEQERQDRLVTEFRNLREEYGLDRALVMFFKNNR
jgi:hypothetical protein